jgi:hypothetical protein
MSPGTVMQIAHHNLHHELLRILALLQAELVRQRERGRTPSADPVQGFVIEEGEAEGLVADLAHDLAQRADCTHSVPPAAVPHTVRSTPPAPQAPGLPLQLASNAFELTGAEYHALLLALAVELDGRFGRLVAFLNDHVGRTRPTLGMAALLEADPSGMTAILPPEWIDRPAIRDGLLELEGDGPLPGKTLRLPPEMLHRLTAETAAEPLIPFVTHRPQQPGLLARIVLSEPVRNRAVVWVNRLCGGVMAPPLIVAGPVDGGRRTLAHAIASEADWPLTVVEFDGDQLVDRLRLARREARWRGGALALHLRESTTAASVDWALFWNELRDLRRPLFLVLPEAAVDLAEAAAPEEPAVVRLEEPDLPLRRALWRAHLPDGHAISADTCELLAARFRFGPGRVSRVMRRAISHTALLREEERRLTAELLEQTCRDVGGALMGNLAQRISLPFRRADLVIPPSLEAELDLALAWMHRQRQVLDTWGFSRRIPYGRGLTALFAGPPGTGKTMAAQVLARELGIDLYRVDFAQLMSKWIGETEKNLSALFDEAQAAGVALFFDEGDAVGSQRKEAKDAHDRHANLEVAHLLKRMEEHEGVTIFATNRMGDLDEAFMRRFHFVLDFPKPNAEQRLRIWEGMFPKEAARDPNLDLTRCACDFELSGGEIKNVVLAAAFLAAHEEKPIGLSHVLTAVHRELLKSGRLADL